MDYIGKVVHISYLDIYTSPVKDGTNLSVSPPYTFQVVTTPNNKVLYI